MDLKDLVKEIAACRKTAAMDPVDFPRRNRDGFAIMVRQAKDRVAELEKEYVTRLQEQSVVVGTYGDAEHVSEFRRLAEAEGVVLSVDVLDFYREIAALVEPSLGRHREWETTQYGLAVQHAMNRGYALGLDDHDFTVDPKANYRPAVVATQADVVEAVRDTVRKALKDVIQKTWVAARLRETALSASLTPDQTVGVLITGARSEDEARTLVVGWLAPAAATVAVSGTPTPDDVINAFRNTKKSAK